jgi:hypothetical protein
MELRIGVEAFVEHMKDSSAQTMPTHRMPAVAVQFDLVGAGLVSAGVLTSQQIADIIALGGGYETRGVTVEQVTDLRAEITRETRIQKIQKALMMMG